jgi:hypothetical protein
MTNKINQKRFICTKPECNKVLLDCIGSDNEYGEKGTYPSNLYRCPTCNQMYLENDTVWDCRWDKKDYEKEQNCLIPVNEIPSYITLFNKYQDEIDIVNYQI